MYRVKNSKKKLTGAYAHGCYIRPGEYVQLWKEIERMAKELNISVSEFVSHSMHLYVFNRKSKASKVMTRRKAA